MKNYKKLIDPERVPGHIAVIMDGNGRWADARGLSRSEGHRAGSSIIEPVVEAAYQLGIRALSLYAFSTENWMRPKTEIAGLWKLLGYFFKTSLSRIKDNGIKIIHSGSTDRLPSGVKKIIDRAVNETASNNKIVLNLCINYGGRQEITAAVNSVLSDRNSSGGKTGCSDITTEDIEKKLYTAGLPELDLIIRTSGEFRISNFLIWQAAYAEMIFLDVLWPDFTPQHLYRSIYEFQTRKRRFGGL
jgi:undecaprenyl diphosphate synthase